MNKAQIAQYRIKAQILDLLQPVIDAPKSNPQRMVAMHKIAALENAMEIIAEVFESDLIEIN